MRTTVVKLVALLCLIGLVTACEPSQYEIEKQAAADARAKKEEQKERWDKLDDELIWTGVVTGYDGWSDEKLVIDYGGRYDAKLVLAHISDGAADCTDEEIGDQFTSTLKRMAPVGTRVGAVRSIDEDGDPHRDEAMIYTLSASQGLPDTKKVSLNERLTKKGVAVPDPFINLWDKNDRQFDNEAVALARDDLSAFDFKNWQKVAKAYRTAVETVSGPVGQCVKRETEEELELEAEQRERDRDHRRWVLGPDGREGTDDDRSYGDERDPDRDSGGSSDSGDGYNIPGWACPTRWC